MKEIKKIAILTGGGDCPGLNAVIRAVVKTAIIKYGLEVVGIKKGYHCLYHKDFIPLTLESVQEILSEGGTILKSSNKDNLFKYPVRDSEGNIVKVDGKIQYEDVSDVAVANLREAGIDALFILGGDGTLTSGRDFARKGVNVIGIPKTIDNDLNCTDYTFGFDTAVNIVPTLLTVSEQQQRATAELWLPRLWAGAQASLHFTAVSQVRRTLSSSPKSPIT